MILHNVVYVNTKVVIFLEFFFASLYNKSVSEEGAGIGESHKIQTAEEDDHQ